MSSGSGAYQTGTGYDNVGDTRAGASSGYGFHGQKQGATIPSLRNGVERYDHTRIKPSSVSTGQNFNGEITFDFTSANNRWLVPSMCCLEVQLTAGRTTAQAMAANNAGAGAVGGMNAAALGAAITAAQPAAGTPGVAKAQFTRLVTDPISSLFRAMRLTCSGVQTENLEHVHLASLLQLATETTPAMADSTLQVGGQAFDFKTRVNDVSAAPGAAEQFRRHRGQILMAHASPVVGVGQSVANEGITLRIPIPLNFFSIQEWIPAARWQLTLEVDPNYNTKAVFNQTVAAHRLSDAGGVDVAATGIENTAIEVKDVTLDICTVKPLIPKVVDSLQLHVPSQSIQMVPLTAAASGDYTIAVPASTFGVLCLVRDSSVETRYSGAADRWARGTNVKNIRWALGSSQWPTVDYNMDLRADAVAVTPANRYAREHADSKLQAAGTEGVVACSLRGARAYSDFVDLCSKKYAPAGMQLDYEDWCALPIFGARLMTPPGEIATNLRVHLDLHDAPVAGDTLYVCALYSKVCTMAWAPQVEYPSVKVDHSI
jgi:hypothetical protein